MSYDFRILSADQIQIGLLPSTELLKSSQNDATGFGDVINSWVLFTKRTTNSDTPLGKLISIMPGIFERVIPQAASFTMDVSETDVPNPDELEVVVLNGKDYYVLESESLDYGLIDCTLQEVSEFHASWDNVEAEEAAEINSRLLAEYILGTAVNNLAGSRQLTVGVASPAVVEPPKVDAVAYSKPSTTVKVERAGTVTVNTKGSVTVDGNVKVAAGFMGILPSDPATAARDKLASFLNK